MIQFDELLRLTQKNYHSKKLMEYLSETRKDNKLNIAMGFGLIYFDYGDLLEIPEDVKEPLSQELAIKFQQEIMEKEYKIYVCSCALNDSKKIVIKKE